MRTVRFQEYADRRGVGDSRRRPYPSDIDQGQWAMIAGCLLQRDRAGRPRSTDLREVVNAVNYRWTTGCAWRMLPHDFPPWETVYTYFRNWRRDGTLPKVRTVCLRRRVGRGAVRSTEYSVPGTEF